MSIDPETALWQGKEYRKTRCMNRSAYFTTGVAIRAFANLSRADVVLHGQENIPQGPTVFVINHFTRTETLLLPYHIYKLTGVPVFSLASDSLFKGALTRIFDMIGVISTKDPNRDRKIIKGLLTGSENWIIFPEGRMVKTKKIIGKGKFLIHYEGGAHKPHTGAASLALRAEFFRRHLLLRERHEPLNVRSFLHTLGIDNLAEIRSKSTAIVPVNLTYYPIRAKENLATYFATRLMKEVPDRVLEELMTEGTMLLDGVDLDIHFGSPIYLDDSLDVDLVHRELQRPIGKDHGFSDDFRQYLRRESGKIMQRYMRAIYDMTTINHEHLFASLLMRHPFDTIDEMDLRRRVFLAIHTISEGDGVDCNIHKSLQEEQVHLLTDDRFGKVENFLELALEKKVIDLDNGVLKKKRRNTESILASTRGRIDNPIDVMVHEVEPLKSLQRLVHVLSWHPSFVVRVRLSHLLLRKEERSYRKDCSECGKRVLSSGGPYLLKSRTRKMGVVLVHSYLSVPEEVKELADYLNGRGYWVYAPRLAGHGTTSEDLAERTHEEWQMSVERGYAILSSICRKVVLGGVSIGGCLALDLAARLGERSNVSGVFAVGPPLRLADYTSSFMPAMDVWNRILARFKRNDLEEDFFHFESENRSANYDRNPIAGVRNVGAFLDRLKPNLAKVRQPCLILHATDDPVVSSEGSRTIFEEIGSEYKEYALLNREHHVIIRGDGSDRVHNLIGNFLRDTGE